MEHGARRGGQGFSGSGFGKGRHDEIREEPARGAVGVQIGGVDGDVEADAPARSGATAAAPGRVPPARVRFCARLYGHRSAKNRARKALEAAEHG